MRYGEQEQGATEFIGFFAAFFVLLVMFGSLIAAGIPLLTAGFAIGATFGFVPLISHVVDTPDFAGQLAALIGIGVGIDYALIVVTRYRAEHARGLDREAALLLAMDTAGRTVFFAGCTVIIALLGLLLLGLSFLHGAAVASAIAVGLTMLAALTLLPALLSRSGRWIDRLHVPLPGQKRRQARPRARRPPRSASRATAPPGGAGPRGCRSARGRRSPCRWSSCSGSPLPALHMRLGTADAGLDPPGTTTREAYDIIAEGFGAGTSGSFLLAVDLERKGDAAAAQRVADAVKGDPDVAAGHAAAALEGRRDRDDRDVPQERAARGGDDAAAGALARRDPAAASSARPARRSSSAARSPRRRTSRASSPTSCRCSSGWSCCSARCC